MILQELCQRLSHEVPQYDLVKEEGSPHQPWFTFQVQVGLKTAQGSGKKKKEAKQAAAKVSLNCYLT